MSNGGTENVNWAELLAEKDEAPLREKRPDAGTTANIMLIVG